MLFRSARKTAILEDGADIAKLSMSAEESQFIETRRLQRSEIAGIFRVPLMLLQADQSTTTYASAEQFMLSFMVHTIRPWLVRIEQSIHRQLLTAPRVYFPEFNPEGMLRGDIATRYAAYATGRQWGWLSVNDIRDRENMNPIEDGDVYLTPLNMQGAGDPAKETDGEPTDGNAEPTVDKLDLIRKEMESYGIGVRAGAITPQTEDEEYFRKSAGFPAIGAMAKDAWTKEANGVRRPVTITPLAGEAPTGSAGLENEEADKDAQ